MPGRTKDDWPSWPEFGTQQLFGKDSDFLQAKQAIVAEYGAESLRKSWLAVCQELEAVTDEIALKGSATIPVFLAQDILGNGFSADQIAALERTGCFVIRGVIPKEETDRLYASLKEYVAENRSQVKGWPEETPSMLMMYDSPVQNSIRTHPNQLKLQRILNELWHDTSGTTSSDPLIYLDGIRDRPPRQSFLGLGPHIDAGSLCRWGDPAYRRVYSHIFSGNHNAFDPWDLGLRQDAKQDLFPGQAHSTVLRTFQGWTALTRTAPREGTLLVVPNLKTTLAYMLLRPFFKPPGDLVEAKDASKWILDESGSFPGTTKPDSQRLSRSSHPHLRLEECLVHIPPMEPGDTVWWHTDVCHAVDPEHQGSQNAAVVYVPACPTTPANKRYVKSQLEATLQGRPPPDYENGSGTDETKFNGYKGHEGISDDARRAFGYFL